MSISKKVLDKYCNFMDILDNKFISIPYLNSLYVPQSICKYNNYYLIGYYYSGKFFKKNSIICILDINGNVINRIMLDNNYHCGGIDIDAYSNSLYISGKCGFVNRYNLDEVMNFCNKKICYTNRYMVDDDNILISSISGMSSVAYLNVYKRKIYVGNFSNNNSVIKVFKLNNNGNVLLNSGSTFNVSYKNIQGMCICNYDGNDYYIFSCSYGRFSDSHIYVSKLINREFVNVCDYVIPPMSEQINNFGDKTLGIIFESGSLRYFNSRYKVKGICFLNINGMLKKE